MTSPLVGGKNYVSGVNGMPQQTSTAQSTGWNRFRTAAADLVDLHNLHTILGIQTEDRNHRRAEAMGDAYLTRHYPEYKPHQDDDVIQWNSPTVNNHYPPPQQPWPAGSIAKALLGTALALGALGGGAGAAMWGYSQLGDKSDNDTVTTIENTEGFILDFPE